MYVHIQIIMAAIIKMAYFFLKCKTALTILHKVNGLSAYMGFDNKSKALCKLLVI